MAFRRRMWSSSEMIKSRRTRREWKSRRRRIGSSSTKDGEQKPFKISVEEKMDNHLAEFTAIDWALGWLLEEGVQEELIFMHTDPR